MRILKIINPNHVPEYLESEERITLVVTESFEERCLGSIQWLRRIDRTPTALVVYRYNTTAEPLQLDRRLRSEHRSAFQEFANATGCSYTELLVNPYAANGLNSSLRDSLDPATTIIVDISCMTRVHLAALASWLAAPNSPDALGFIYSEPESYGPQQHDVGSGWRDTIFVPIGHAAKLRREGHARGIILAGHDNERLSMALLAIEPASGLFILAVTPERPDFMKRTQEVNADIAERLLTLRMPRSQPVVRDERMDRWTQARVKLTGFASLAEMVAEQALAAGVDDGPIFFFPFGPKILSFSVCLNLTSLGDIAAYLVYPIPHNYHVNHSIGIARSHFLVVASS